MTSLRERWAAGHATFNGWLTVPSPVVAETLARTGFDSVCVDLQHGVLDYRDLATIVPSIDLGGSTPIARVPWNEPGIIGKVLDAGVQAVIVPMVNSADEARAVVRAVRYAPVGARSYGPTLAAPRTPDYFEGANHTIAAIAMIETVEALSHLDDIVSVPGIDAVYVGPADLSITLGLSPANHHDDDVFTDALTAIVDACRRHGVTPGIHATAALAERRLEQGFRLITVSSDLASLRAGATADLATARSATPSGAATGPY
jgi:4-hydroxy-2-oxoheptanedioate aldolase